MTRPTGLTPQQARVAILVAAHKTDRQIAAELGIGERTVRWHIQRIVAAWELKPGLVIRTQIAERVPKKAA